MSLNPVVLRNATDSYTSEAAPSRNFGGSTQIVAKSGTGTRLFGWIYFARPFPLGVTILDAKLKLYQISTESATHTVTIRRIDAPWYVSQINWNNQPGSITTGQVQVTQAGGPIGTEWEFDVTAHMQLVSDGTLWRGWQIFTSLDDYLYLGSTQHAQYKPVLEVTWADNPDAPSTLSPSGNRAVSVAKPVLRFDFTDVAGNTSLQAVQVQINATNVWTSPTFDSGTVVTSDPELDLNTTAYAGLSDGASTYWRVRVQDGAGLWSDWSAGAQFQRQTKGTLTLTNPPISGLISEPTPPIIWGLSGRTQQAWQVMITRTTWGTPLYNTGKRTGTDVSHTLPDGILKDDQSYRAVVRIWDTISRESTPNDPPWTEVSRVFTYDYDATVDPVTSLVATDLAPAPGVTLTWSRATAPDSFLVRRNGIIIDSNLDPAELSTGGTGYTYTDRGADPRKAVTWRVDSVVNGKTSASNPTVVKTLMPVGIWLQDLNRDIAVQILDQESGTWSMGEQAETYTPVGASRVIRITQALRGYEGSISGRIMTTDTGTVAEKEAAIYQLKETPGYTYLMTLADMTIPVVIGDILVQPLPNKNEVVKLVSFSFWQNGDLPFDAVV